MKKSFFLILLIFNFLNAQDIKLGKVTIEELQEKEHPIEKEASACKIFSIRKTYMTFSQNKGFELITEVENKIKIYNSEGLSYADFSVPVFRNDSEKETVSFSDAYTYNIGHNNKIEKTKLKNEGEFEEKINKYYTLKKITMPNVKVGSIIEYKYTIRSPFLSNVDEWVFQEEIPVNYTEYTFRYPDYFQYNPFVKGTINLNPKNTIEAKSIKITSKEKDSYGFIVPNSFSESEMSYNEIINNYSALNVSSLIDEKFVKNINNFRSSITFELASIKYPNQPFKLLSTTWEDVAKTVNSSDGFGGELNKKGYFEDEIKPVFINYTSQEQRLLALFQYVKENFKWNGYYSIYAEEGLKSTFKNKTGNVADINLLLTVFLREAGLNAHPVLISSVSNGIPLFPSRTAFNYLVVGVDYEGDTILLDATDQYSEPNILPSRALNWKGRMIYQNGGSKEVNLEPKILSLDNILLDYSIDSEAIIKGTLKRQLTNYNAHNYRQKYASVKQEVILENKEKDYGNILIDDYKAENVEKLYSPIVESISFTDDKNAEVIGDKIYFSPMLFLKMETNPFKKENRNYPIEFPFPYVDKLLISIKIPEGYELESLPTTENLVFADKVLSHKYIVNTQDNTIKVMIQENINITILSSENYDGLKDYFQKKLNKQNEKIVLKRKI